MANRTKSEKIAYLERVGWTVYILECADGSYFAGWTHNMKSAMVQILLDSYFFNNPERLPFKVIYEEKDLIFKEAQAKHEYLRLMNRRQRIKLITTGKWAKGGPWKEYLKKFPEIDATNDLTLTY